MDRERWLGGRLRLVIAIVLIAGALAPVAARERRRYDRATESRYTETELHFTWEAADVLSEERAKSDEKLLALFILLPPLFGFAALALMAMRNRSARAGWYIGMGALPLVLLLVVSSKVVQGVGIGTNLVGLVISSLMLGGLVVAWMRPDEDLGYQVAGWAGVASLVSMFLPTAPDLQNAGEKTFPLENLIQALDVPKVGMIAFAVGLLGLVATLFTASLVLRAGNREGRTRTSLILVLAGLAAMFLLPFVVYVVVGSKEPFFPLLVVTVSLVGLRVLPSMGLLAAGVSEALVLKMGVLPATDASPERTFRDHCDAIRSAHRRLAAGELDAGTFRAHKVRLLKAAVADARRTGKPRSLLEALLPLRESGALNDVEFESVKQVFVRKRTES